MTTYRGRGGGAPKQWKKDKRYCCHGTCSSNTKDFDPEVKMLPFPKPCSIYITTIYDNNVTHDVNMCTQCSKARRWLHLCKLSDMGVQELSVINKMTYICSKHFADSNGPTEMHPDPFPADKDELTVMADSIISKIKEENHLDDLESDPLNTVDWQFKIDEFDSSEAKFFEDQTEDWLPKVEEVNICEIKFERDGDWELKTEEVDVSVGNTPGNTPGSGDMNSPPHLAMADSANYVAEKFTQEKDPKNSKLKSKICAKRLARKGGIGKHKSSKKGLEAFTCNICAKTYSSKSNLKHHSISHAVPKPIECKYCLKSFTQEMDLAFHIKSHTGPRPFECSYCTKTFPFRASLTVHLRVHTGFKPYKCDICSGTFSLKNNMEANIKTHTGFKPFKCQTCSKSFAQKCKICLKTFPQKGSLYSHMKTPTGLEPFECEKCSKAFAHLGSLTGHMTTQNGLRPFQCNICSRAFGKIGNLKAHMPTHTDIKHFK